MLTRTALVVTLLVASAAAVAAPGPWRRTEVRADCASANPVRNPYFGDLHIHTGFSVDAYIFGTKVTPRDAYTFATGGEILISDENEAATRPVRIDRPIDFAAVTDHAEWYGGVRVCLDPVSPAYDHQTCQSMRQAEPPDQQFPVVAAWQYQAGIPNAPRQLSFCTTPGVDCDAAAVSVWQDIQAAAEAYYDRTAACAFTTFIGYEHTASPLGKHLHRNIIFRNEHVPATAKSVIDTGLENTPQGVWDAVESDCLNAGTGCDAVIIPHNSNLSGAEQFVDPIDAADARRRQDLEPLAEIHQVKGNSECRFDRLAGRGVGTSDELCTFEQEPHAQQGPGGDPIPTIDEYPARNMIRNALKDGLGFEQTLGVNPFRFGFTGSTDTHDGTAGNTAEVNWPGIGGNGDVTPALQIADNIRNNPGGLTVAWAEENSRDALFDALRRRETYATTGTRPVIRFFGGNLDGVACDSTSLVRDAYATGTPMGGELGAVRGKKSPRFVVWATKDPGTAERPGTDLQRIQIVKGWVDARGETHEQVFDVAGSADNGAGVDANCAPTGSGAAELCTVWRDPDFDRRERAFYYARVLENPTCRWSTFVCKAAGVEPLATDCPAQAAVAGPAFANCCLGRGNDAFADPLTQERAWTSPIWYRPESAARLTGKLRFGKRPGTDVLVLRVKLGAAPDVAANDLSIRVSDDEDIYSATIPAGALAVRHGGLRALGRGTQVPGLRKASLTSGGLLRLETSPADLSGVARDEHMVTVSLAIGMSRASVARLWTPHGNALVPGAK